MTQTPTPEPIVITSYAYRVLWQIVPSDEGTINTTIPGTGDEDTEPEIDPFPSTGTLDTVDITPDFNKIFDDIDPYNIINETRTRNGVKIGFRAFDVTGKVQRFTITETTTENEEGEEETETTYAFTDVPYRLNSMTITSSHEKNTVWIFPDQFPGSSVPEGTPKEYGGVVFENAEPVPVTKNAGEVSRCGTDGESGYQYLDVFFDYDFRYIPRNSVRLDSPGVYEDKDVVNSRDRFPTKPRLPFVEDEDGLKAPIMPIDMVTRYEGDERESYTITYKIVFDATINQSFGGIQNPVLTLTQTVIQDVENFGEQLQILLGIANFNFVNINGLSFKDMSPGYPYAYPYTCVSGFDGQPAVGEPTRRNTISGSSEGRLEKGDLWHDPRENIRKYYQINSFVEDVKIISPGTIYMPAPGPADFTELLQKNKNFMKSLDNIFQGIDTYLEGDTKKALRQLKGDKATFEEMSIDMNDDVPLKPAKNLSTFPMKLNSKGEYVMNTDSTGQGLKVDVLVNKDGGVETATVVSRGTGYKDKETVAIYGGDCILEVKVNSDEFWRDEFVDRLGIGKSQFLGGFSLEQ